MNTFSDNHAAIYEEPVDERIRKFLKLENYFLKINKHKEMDSIYDSLAALNSLISLYQTMSRAEVKRELIRDLPLDSLINELGRSSKIKSTSAHNEIPIFRHGSFHQNFKSFQDEKYKNL